MKRTALLFAAPVVAFAAWRTGAAHSAITAVRSRLARSERTEEEVFATSGMVSVGQPMGEKPETAG